MTKTNHCKRCKKPIPEGIMCEDCKEIDYQNKLDKRKNRQLSKYQTTREYGISQVKKYADGRLWCSTHKNEFKCNPSIECDAHILKKFQRYLYHLKLGRIVFTELQLKEGLGRPDILVVCPDNFIFLEEIVNTEKEASLIKKKEKYPFPINIIYCDKKG